jgi:amino acid adenylation domain-containing protein
MHHTISDGWSVGVFSFELAELYDAAATGRAPQLPPLPIQYADYAIWETEWLDSPAGRSQLAYWKARLAGAPRPVELPTDRPRGAAPTFRGGLVPFRLAPALTADLKALSRASGATLFMTLLAGFAALVSRVTGETDVAIGSMAANRGLPESEPLIGFFVNALVYRLDVAGDPSFRALLARVKEAAIGAYANQQLPFERLVEELRPQRELAKNPLFCLCLTLQNAPLEVKLPGLVVTPMPAENGTAKFDVSLEMWEDGAGGIAGRFEYAKDLFEHATVEALGARYARVLEAVAKDPRLAVSALPLVSEDERRASLVTLEETRRSFDERPVTALFAENARRAPQALAISSGSRALTYGELDARANRLAHTLLMDGVTKETVVAIFAARSVDLVVGALGVLKAGGAYLPLDPAAPPERIRRALQEAGAPIVLAEKALASRLPSSRRRVVLLDGRLASRDESDPGVPIAPSQLAYVITTSGSSGAPKCVEVTHAGLSNLVGWHLGEYRVTPADKATLVASPAFDASVWEMWPYLAAGASLHVPDDETRDDPRRLLSFLAERRITLSFLPTPLAEAVLAEPGLRETALDLRALLVGGDRLHAIPEGLPFRVVNHYGPTEATVVTTFAAVEPGDSLPPIGRPIANMEIAVLDGEGRPVAPGVPGELHIGGKGLARGYRGRPDLTDASFVASRVPELSSARLYKTGDLVRVAPGGALEFLGRADEQVKVRGIRIEPGDVESYLSRAPGVKECAVVARGEGAQARLVAFIVPRNGAVPAPAELRRALAGSLPASMIPSSFVPLDALPKTPSGKVDRRALPDAAPSSAPRANPTDVVERKLAAIWSNVLGVPSVGLDDNYFELGGHSLLAVRLFSEIEKSFSRALPLATIFQAPTIRELAVLLRETSWKPSWSSLVPIQPEGSRPPFYCVHAIGGNVLTYADLARHLGKDQPVWGLQARGLDGKQPLPDTLEEMARNYLREVRELQPTGPYFLGGSSAGGLVAYEMAQQLAAVGQEVRVLALFDTWGPDYPDRLPGVSLLRRKATELAERVDLHVGNFLVAEGLGAKLRYIATKAGRVRSDLAKALRRRARRIKKSLDDLLHPLPYALKRVEKEGRRAVDVYEVKPYAGPIVLFRASKQPAGHAADPALGWARVAVGGLEIHEVPGYHGAIVYEPRVKVLAEVLEGCLAGRQAEPVRG